ncbi:hypothetical protein ABPG73_008123 [Tetrahymena malaccensis]
MGQQINSFNSLKDFQKSNFKALISIELQLKNFDFNSKQIDVLNTSLKKCCKLESLVLNLQQECIQDEELNPFFIGYKRLIDLIPNFNNMSNDQRYSHMQFLLKNYGYKELPIEPKKSEQIRVLRDFLQDDTISNLVNLKSLKLNLSGNSMNDKVAFTICTLIGRFKMLTNLNLQLWNNQISDVGISNIGVGISCCLNLTGLTLNIADFLSLQFLGIAYDMGSILDQAKVLFQKYPKFHLIIFKPSQFKQRLWGKKHIMDEIIKSDQIFLKKSYFIKLLIIQAQIIAISELKVTIKQHYRYIELNPIYYLPLFDNLEVEIHKISMLDFSEAIQLYSRLLLTLQQFSCSLLKENIVDEVINQNQIPRNKSQ